MRNNSIGRKADAKQIFLGCTILEDRLCFVPVDQKTKIEERCTVRNVILFAEKGATVIRCFAVDDDKNAVETLRVVLEDFCPEVQLIGSANNLLHAAKKLQGDPPDLLFLDVELKEGTGFDLLEILNQPELLVIFISGHQNHAIEAVGSQAIGYLMKPVNPEKLIKLIEQVKARTPEAPDSLPSTIAVPTGSGYRTIEPESIVWLEASGSYTCIHLETGEQLLVSRRLKQFEEQLSSKDFFRAHYGIITNLQHMHEYNRLEGYLSLSNGKKVEVARRRREELIQVIRNRSRMI